MKKLILTLVLVMVVIFAFAMITSALKVLDQNGNEYYPQDVKFTRQNGATVSVNDTFYLPSCTTPSA